MNARRMRVEIIRFSLLIIITVALISVATRHGRDHGTAAASRSASPPSGSTSAPTAGSHRGGGTGTRTSGPDQGTTRQATTGQSNTGQGSTGQGPASGSTPPATTGATVAQLPRTGATQAAELAGLAALLITAGSLSVTVSRRAER